MPRRLGLIFSPTGRRWREAPDEGRSHGTVTHLAPSSPRPEPVEGAFGRSPGWREEGFHDAPWPDEPAQGSASRPPAILRRPCGAPQDEGGMRSSPLPAAPTLPPQG